MDPEPRGLSAAERLTGEKQGPQTGELATEAIPQKEGKRPEE